MGILTYFQKKVKKKRIKNLPQRTQRTRSIFEQDNRIRKINSPQRLKRFFSQRRVLGKLCSESELSPQRLAFVHRPFAVADL